MFVCITDLKLARLERESTVQWNLGYPNLDIQHGIFDVRYAQFASSAIENVLFHLSGLLHLSRQSGEVEWTRFCCLLKKFISGGVDYGPFPTNEISLLTVVPAQSSVVEFGMNIREDSIVEAAETFNVTLQLFLGGFDPFQGGNGEGELSDVLSEAVVTIQDNDCMCSGFLLRLNISSVHWKFMACVYSQFKFTPMALTNYKFPWDAQ